MRSLVMCWALLLGRVFRLAKIYLFSPERKYKVELMIYAAGRKFSGLSMCRGLDERLNDLWLQNLNL